MIRLMLFKLSAHLPCRLIHREGLATTERYLERYALWKGFGLTIYLHRFVAEDADKWVHDHPWSWAMAFLLTGGYREERVQWLDPSKGWKSIWKSIGGWRRFNFIKGSDFHRITKTKPETWTVFIHGPRVKDWGFLQQFGPYSDAAGVFYHQPFEVSKNSDWIHRAPKGNEANRAPLSALRW